MRASRNGRFRRDRKLLRYTCGFVTRVVLLVLLGGRRCEVS